LGVKVLGDDGVLGIEGAGLREEGVGGCGLSEEAGLPGLSCLALANWVSAAARSWWSRRRAPLR
jgi:hypothetical protein